MRRSAPLLFVGWMLVSAAAAASEAGHADGVHIDWTILGWSVVNLAIFLAILFRLLKKPVARMMVERSETVGRRIAELDRMKADLAGRIGELEGRLSQLAQEREGILARYREAAERERERILAEASERGRKIGEETERVVEQTLTQARDRLRRELAAEVVRQASAVAAREIRPVERQALVDDFIRRMEAGGDQG